MPHPCLAPGTDLIGLWGNEARTDARTQKARVGWTILSNGGTEAQWIYYIPSSSEEGKNCCCVQLNKEAGLAQVVGTVSVAEPSSDPTLGEAPPMSTSLRSWAKKGAQLKDTQAERDISTHNLFLTDDKQYVLLKHLLAGGKNHGEGLWGTFPVSTHTQT